MAPLVPSAKATLSYPLWACDFDPLDSSRLVVGGGGGAGRSGVGNKITLLDTSKASELKEVGEIDLSKDEDNVTSLAVGQRKGETTLVYAGANSRPEDIKKGRNKHFRIFGIEAATSGTSKITELSRSSLFTGTEKDSYQRLLRLTKPYPNQPQLGAIATGLTKKSEIVLFETSATQPMRSRGAVQSNKEPVDADLIQTGENEYMFAYCDEHDVFVKKITPDNDDEEPREVYITPASRSHEKVTIPSFRAMRWLTKDFLLMLTNIHGNSGAVLQILRLPPSGNGHCRIAQSLRLPSRITKGTGLAVANLTPPLSPTAEQDYTQFVIAVAGHDISITLFKVNLQVERSVAMPTKIREFRTFKNVHPNQTTGLCFSNFVPPTHPVTASTPPQCLKLASISVSSTVVVHTLPLFPVPLSIKRGQSRTPRYVVALPSGATAMAMSLVLCTLGILLGAVFIQSLLEIRGAAPNWVQARSFIPLRVQEVIGRPYEFPGGYKSSIASTKDTYASGYNHHIGVPADDASGSALRLPEIFSSLKSESDGTGVFVVHEHADAEGGIKAKLHDEEVHGPHGGQPWEELKHEQRQKWIEKLKQAGYWAEDMGETILKGVVFGELGAAVGQAVAGG
ncbi:Uncharacterized protein BP5553_07295 [Venustampulla echinocandica]|uniref:Guanine nucleotide-exchange factor SEC12 n=1 Tax=Venustampulla echinocandica TaxID=2656787 RepID=A0A370TJ25_9HELO|nr:Uncharacterized protein BP5553_07295 [Venustampulla echinocandica]RDL35364.1 Uncharacterized protein BP5553_07295 [Venustampulla echinocandica]